MLQSAKVPALPALQVCTADLALSAPLLLAIYLVVPMPKFALMRKQSVSLVALLECHVVSVLLETIVDSCSVPSFTPEH